MDTDDLIFFESERKEIYKGLAACFSLPDAHLVPILGTLSHLLKAQVSEAADPVSQMAAYASGLQDFSALKVEFSRLFVGPYGQLAPPFGSAYLDEEHTLMSESARDAMGRYREAGLVIADTFWEAPDHIVPELEFLCFLITQEIDALAPETEGVPQTFLLQQKEFLSHHLGSWVEPFTEKITRFATSLFYQHLAKATRMIVKEDMDYLDTPGLCEQTAPKRCGQSPGEAP